MFRREYTPFRGMQRHENAGAREPSKAPAAEAGRRPRLDGGPSGPRGSPGERGSCRVWLALTVVVVLTLVLILAATPLQFAVFVLLGLVIEYYRACREAQARSPAPQRGSAGAGDHPRETARREGLTARPAHAPLAGSTEVYGPADQPAPYPVFAETGAPSPALMTSSGLTETGGSAYPGAIELDEYETLASSGHTDRSRYEDPPEGNPFDPMRVRADLAAGPCVDDEANDNEIDGDEKMAYQGSVRNDATRVTAGTINRRRDMDKYFREEVEEAEEREWWGRHEL